MYNLSSAGLGIEWVLELFFLAGKEMFLFDREIIQAMKFLALELWRIYL